MKNLITSIIGTIAFLTASVCFAFTNNPTYTYTIDNQTGLVLIYGPFYTPYSYYNFPGAPYQIGIGEKGQSTLRGYECHDADDNIYACNDTGWFKFGLDSDQQKNYCKVIYSTSNYGYSFSNQIETNGSLTCDIKQDDPTSFTITIKSSSA